MTVTDDCGNNVPGADVTGIFSGDISETVKATTNATGTAVLETVGTARHQVRLTFCVDNIFHSLAYDPLGNVETCDSN